VPFGRPAAGACVYLGTARRSLVALAPGPESDAGLRVQIASTVNVSAEALPLTTVATHVSGRCPSAGCSKSESVMLTAGSVESVDAPPPITRNPDGQLTAFRIGGTGCDRHQDLGIAHNDRSGRALNFLITSCALRSRRPR
jgi:hypothetical protein